MYMYISGLSVKCTCVCVCVCVSVSVCACELLVNWKDNFSAFFNSVSRLLLVTFRVPLGISGIKKIENKI